MTRQTTSIEANLMFDAPLGTDLATQSEEIHGCIEYLGFRVASTRVMPNEHLLITCDRVQILAAYCDAPFAVDEFAGASRPEDDPVADRLVLDTLERHAASVKVMITDRPGAEMNASMAEKRFLAWEITDLLAEALPVALVFWNDGDTLYTAGEFARSAPPGENRPVMLSPEDFAPKPATDTAAETSTHPGAHAFALSPDDGLDELECETERRAATEADWARVSRGFAPEPLDDGSDELISEGMARKGTNYGLLTVLLALNFPVAMAVLFYQLMRGEDAHIAAKVVCVTALGVALNDTGLAAHAMAII